MALHFKTHGYKVGTSEEWFDDVPSADQPEDLEQFAAKARKRLEPWLSAVFQAEHLNLLIGSGVYSRSGLSGQGHIGRYECPPIGHFA
jgi:hypothetical protein